MPVRKELEKYECRHGIGYTQFYSQYQGIATKIKIFVPFGKNVEIWTVELNNLTNKQKQISIFTYLEWCLGVAPDNHREFHKSFIETDFDKDKQVLLARKRLWEIPSERGHWNTEWSYTAYFAWSEAVDGFEGDKEKFKSGGGCGAGSMLIAYGEKMAEALFNSGLGLTLPVSRHTEKFRAVRDFAGGGRSPYENPPRNAERRQGALFSGENQ